jgi:hypothetical protein
MDFLTRDRPAALTGAAGPGEKIAEGLEKQGKSAQNTGGVNGTELQS